MQFDLEKLSRRDRYKVAASLVTPRPIAWVTSLSEDGRLNAAPFSFFNLFGDDPPIIALGVVLRDPGRLKDTAVNIRARREFVVNIVNEAVVGEMNATSIDAPPDIGEPSMFGIATEASLKVAPPRIAAAPASLECRLNQIVEVSPGQSIIIGEAVQSHVQDRFVTDAERCTIDIAAMRLVARMHGPGWYTKTTELFDLRRPQWSEAIA